jgi:hypothetical protein
MPLAVKKRSTAIRQVPAKYIERKIYLIRGYKVMLDSDLARLYQVPTKVFNQAVRRNLDRFPPDFMFQLKEEEEVHLRARAAARHAYPKDLSLHPTAPGAGFAGS